MSISKDEPRLLRCVAQEIAREWKPVNYAAKPYLDAMLQLEKITDTYYADSGQSVVLYFLSNASTWRGDVARRIKKELRAMLDTL